MCIARHRHRRTPMTIDLSPLLEQSFFVEEGMNNASESIERALQTYEQKFEGGARAFELGIIDNPDEDWVRERLVHELTYFCESEGMALPKCAGVVVTAFVGNKLYAVT